MKKTVSRSAKSGKFVTAKKAKKSPNTTVTEKVKKPVKVSAKLEFDCKQAIVSIKKFKAQILAAKNLIQKMQIAWEKMKHARK